ncbi:F-box domain [Macleaya cordata]|uniref:F-box domain n=1 Tax=Macleaya cordata TaxID=56857 RepID=A0A200PT06_MACCD|nr:F-box domain [Macleaya cordata]
MAKVARRDESTNSDWAELTHECLMNILSRLSLEERWKGAMFVCKSWFHACKDPPLFSVFDLETVFESGTESSLWWSPDFERKIDSMLQSVVNWSGGVIIKEIRIRHCSDQSLSFVAERCPNLQVLAIKSCPNVTNTSIAKIASGCPMLMELDISYCYKISHESLKLIGSHCPNLKILKRNLMNSLDPSQHLGIVPKEYLKASPRCGNKEAAAIGKFMPNLEHLELRFSKLSPYGFTSSRQGCCELKYLDLFGCPNLSSQLIEEAEKLMINRREVKKAEKELKTAKEELKKAKEELKRVEEELKKAKEEHKRLQRAVENLGGGGPKRDQSRRLE